MIKEAEEAISNNFQKPDFDSRLLPDKLQPADMQEYGYKWDGILPLTKERAAELFDSDVTVYKLHPNSTETAVEDKILDIEQYDGMFGVEKRDWLIYLRDKIELMSEADREGLINGVEAGFDNGYDLAAEDIAIYHCITSNVKLPEKLTEHITGVEPVDKKGFLEDRIILKTSDNDYIYSAEFNKDYDDGKIHLTNNLDTDEYKFEVLGNSERINDLEAANNYEPIEATYEESKQLLLSDYIEQNREIADEVYISVGDASNRDYFDSPKEIYYGTLADLPKELLNAKVIDKSQIVASSFPERNGSWQLIIECIPQKEMTYTPEDIEQLIGNRKHTHHGFYADISDAVSDVPTDKLVEYYKEKLGESRLRDFLETEISKAEILKEKNKNFCKSNSKTHEEYER